jgi:glycerol-3-phosphate acyltransferase PlsX
MGGDYGPKVVVPAALDALQNYPQLEIILVGDQQAMARQLQDLPAPPASRLHLQPTSQTVAMDESPSSALRGKKDSSMRVAVNLVKQQQAHACVSAGNTGALMAMAKFVLKTLPGIDRPAIIYPMPTDTGQAQFGCIRMLDLGANVDCNEDHLFQFSVMGSVLAKALDQKATPRIGLLNIGSEAIKGSEVVKRTALKLTHTSALNYIGFIEGTDIFQNKADVVVCDGFVGNVALKSSEGVANMLLNCMKREFTKNWRTKMIALLARPVLKGLRQKFDPTRYNGATLIGLNGIVIKSHGNATTKSFYKAITEAINEAEQNIPALIRSEVALYLGDPKVP